MSNQKLLEHNSAKLTALHEQFKEATEERNRAETLVADSKYSIELSERILEGHRRNLHKGKLQAMQATNKLGELEREINKLERAVRKLTLLEAQEEALLEMQNVEKQLKALE